MWNSVISWDILDAKSAKYSYNWSLKSKSFIKKIIWIHFPEHLKRKRTNSSLICVLSGVLEQINNEIEHMKLNTMTTLKLELIYLFNIFSDSSFCHSNIEFI